MLISTLNCEMWPNFSYRGVRSVQLLLLLLLLMVFSSENFGFSPPYAGIAGIGPAEKSQKRVFYQMLWTSGRAWCTPLLLHSTHRENRVFKCCFVPILLLLGQWQQKEILAISMNNSGRVDSRHHCA